VSEIDKLIAAYEIDVQFPDVSGMEHLEMLLTRTEIARLGEHLTAPQRRRLEKADQMLVEQARRFYEAIDRIADLRLWRDEQNAPPAHWWWYLDVLAQLPQSVTPASPPQAVPA